MDTPTPLLQVSPHVFMSKPESGHFEQVTQSAIVLKSFIIVVDTNLFPSDARRFRATLEEKFQLPIKYTFITHFHTDHIGGMNEYRDTIFVGSNILAKSLRTSVIPTFSKNQEKYLKTYPDRPEDIHAMVPHPLDIAFDSNIRFYEDDFVIEARFAGGHSPGSAFLFLPMEKVVIAGDLLWENRIPNSKGTWSDPDLWITQLQKMASLDCEWFVPGHGNMISKADFGRYLSYFEAMRSSIQEAIQEGKSVDDVSFPEIYDMQVSKYAKTRTLNIARWWDYYKGGA